MWLSSSLERNCAVSCDILRAMVRSELGQPETSRETKSRL